MQLYNKWMATNPPPDFNPASVELHRMYTKKMRRPKKPKLNPDDESEESDMDEPADEDEDEYEDEDVRLLLTTLTNYTFLLSCLLTSSFAVRRGMP